MKLNRDVSNTSGILLVRPGCFAPHAGTKRDNRFQRIVVEPGTGGPLHDSAVGEFDAAVECLRGVGFDPLVVSDSAAPCPDSVFPNNWLSVLPDGRVVLYPLMSPLRRPERRSEVIDALRTRTSITGVIDLTSEEKDGRYLEGTGSIVFDHQEGIAYLGRSARSDESVLHRLVEEIGYRSVVFDTIGPGAMPVYHTNVILSVGWRTALICLEMIPDGGERRDLLRSLRSTGKSIIPIGASQAVRAFVGNALEVRRNGSAVTLLSAVAARALTPQQRDTLLEASDLVPLSIPTIELSGGSVRCMIVDF